MKKTLKTDYIRCDFIIKMFLLRRLFGSDTPPPVPLSHISLKGHVSDTIARIDITQVYRNTEDFPIETEYIFPVYRTSAVVDLCIETEDGRTLQGQIQELEEAKEGYADAVSDGNVAVLGIINTQGNIVISVGNIPGKSRIKVRFSIIQPVECSGNKWVLRLPAVLFPVINTELEALEEEISVEDRGITYIYPEHCSYRLYYEISIESSAEIVSLTCVSHDLRVEMTGNRRVGRVVSGEKGFVPERDVEIQWETIYAGSPVTRVQYNPASNRYSAMVGFIPAVISSGEVADEVTGMGEFIYILDRSGSMAGSRIDMARQAAVLFLKSLPANSTFNIVSFGSNIEPLFPHSQPYNQDTVTYAVSMVSGYKANLGGTNMLLPLDWVAARAVDVSRPRAVFLLTDGEVDNPEMVIGFIEAHAKETRVFPFGIGPEVSPFFLQYLAEAGHGTAESISNLPDIRGKVISILQICTKPALCDVMIQWVGGNREQFSSNERLSAVYYGEVGKIYADLGENRPGDGDFVRIRGKNSKTGEEIELQAVLNSDFMREGQEIETLFANEALKELFFRERRDRDAAMKRKIVDLSKRSGIPCVYTAFLCVEKRTDPVTEKMQFKAVPAVLPSNNYLRKRIG